MNGKKIFWGVFFITIGALILMNNFSSVDMNWHFIWKLWPVLLVLIGLNHIFRESRSRWIISLTGALLAGLVIFSAYKTTTRFISHGFMDDMVIDDSDFESFDWDNGKDDSAATDTSSVSNEANVYTLDMDNSIKTGLLHLEAAAGSIKVRPPVSNMFSIETKGNFINYNYNADVKNGRANIYFTKEKSHVRLKKGFIKSNIDIALNSAPVWDVDFDLGASYADMDLSPYKISRINFHSGASSVKLKLGDLYKNTALMFESGVSSVEILVPRSSGVQISMKNSLAARDFDNFQKTGDNTYRTGNYNSASKKIDIKLEAGISSIKVHQY
ncbi:MAG: LiaI-LiaF-like domain-containing protein [Bacteroidota bacterium]